MSLLQEQIKSLKFHKGSVHYLEGDYSKEEILNALLNLAQKECKTTRVLFVSSEDAFTLWTRIGQPATPNLVFYDPDPLPTDPSLIRRAVRYVKKWNPGLIVCYSSRCKDLLTAVRRSNPEVPFVIWKGTVMEPEDAQVTQEIVI